MKSDAERDNQEMQARLTHIEASMAHNDFMEARREWSAFRADHPDDWHGYVRGAVACMEVRQWEEAEKLAEQALTRFPDLYEAHLTFAEIARRAGGKNLPVALARFAGLRARFPRKHHGYSLAARACMELGDFARAEALCREGMAALPQEHGPLVLFAEAAMRQGEYAEAIARYDALVERFPQLEYAYSLGAAPRLRGGDLAGAEALCRLGRERLPQAFAPAAALADIALRKKEYAEALRQWRVLMKKFPEEEACYMGAASVCRCLGKKCAEREYLENGLKRLPCSRALLLAYLLFLMEEKEYAEAQRFLYAVFFRRFPKDPKGLEQLLRIRRMSGAEAVDTDIFRLREGMSTAFEAMQLITGNFDNLAQVEDILKRQSFSEKTGDLIREYQKQKLDMLNTVRRRYEFDLVSLGDRCWTGSIFSRWGLKLQQENSAPRLPFDLGGTPTEELLHLLENDFSGYDDSRNIGTIGDFCWYEKFGLCEEIFNSRKSYYENKKYPNLVFNHDAAQNYANREEFAKELTARVTRFRKVCRERNKLFLHIDVFSPFTEEILQRFINLWHGSENYLLLIDESTTDLNQLSERIYHMGLPALATITPNHLNTKEFVVSDTGFSLELSVVTAIKDMIVRHFPKRKLELSGNEVRKQIKNAYHNELYHSRQMRTYLEKVKPRLKDSTYNGAIVMNCNPFTNGHKYLVDYAAKMVEKLIVFVVEEDKSIFRFTDRYMLAQQSCVEYENVVVVPSGAFIASTTTAPDYFFKETEAPVKFDGSRDLMFFGKFIAPALNIKIRFFGTEPHCVNTGEYNAQAHEILETWGIRVQELERLQHAGQPVSARTVRQLLHEGKLEEIRPLVPEPVFNFLCRYHLKPEYALYRV